MEREIYTVEFGAIVSEEDAKKLFNFFKEGEESRRDWELLQLSKHITQLREEFNDSESLKLLEATLQTNAMLVREDHEQM